MASYAGPVIEGALALLPDGYTGPALDGGLTLLPAAFAGPTLEGALGLLPAGFSGPVVDAALLIFPSKFSGPVIDEPLNIGPPVVQPPAFSGPEVSGPLDFIALAPIPVPPPPAPPPPPEPVLVSGALVVTPSTVDIDPVEGDTLNRYNERTFFALARRQSGSTLRRIGRFTGPAYQFGPSWSLTLGPKSDLEVVFTSVVNILTTPIGSMPYDPFIGSELPNLVFEPNDSVTQGLIRYFVERDLRRQEPRANVLSVRTVVPENDPHTVVVTVAFQIVGDSEGRVYSAPISFNTLRLAA